MTCWVSLSSDRGGWAPLPLAHQDPAPRGGSGVGGRGLALVHPSQRTVPGLEPKHRTDSAHSAAWNGPTLSPTAPTLGLHERRPHSIARGASWVQPRGTASSAISMSAFRGIYWAPSVIVSTGQGEGAQATRVLGGARDGSGTSAAAPALALPSRLELLHCLLPALVCHPLGGVHTGHPQVPHPFDVMYPVVEEHHLSIWHLQLR